MDPEKDRTAIIEAQMQREQEIERIKQFILRNNAQQNRQNFDDAQTDVDEIKRDIENNIDEIEFGKQLPSQVENSPEKKRKVIHITEVVKQTLIAIQEDRIQTAAADTSKEVLRKIAFDRNILMRVNEKNCVYIDEIIKRGLNNQLNSIDHLIDAFRAIRNLEFLDEEVHNIMARKLQDIARELGGSEEQLNELRTDKQIKGDAELGVEKRIRDKDEAIAIHNNAINAIYAVADSLTTTRIDGTTIDATIREEIKNLGLNNTALDQKRLERIDAIKFEIKQLASDVLKTRDPDIQILRDPTKTYEEKRKQFGIGNPEDISKNVGRFKSRMLEYRMKGLISYQEYNRLCNSIDDVQKVAIQELQRLSSNIGGTLSQLAAQYLSLQKNSIEEKLIQALEGYDSFKESLRDKSKLGGRYDFTNVDPAERTRSWELFSEDVQNLFEKLFKKASMRPNDFWNEGFYEFHEGQMFKKMVDSLVSLGEQIKNDPDMNVAIKIWDFDSQDELFKTIEDDRVPNPRLADIKYVDRSFGEEIGRVLAIKMINLKNISEYTHNISVITQLGMGFDKIAEYSARVNMRDIDWLFKATPGLTEAYNLYITNMGQELATNNYVFRQNFGQKDHENFDSIERMTYDQLRAILQGKDEKIERLVRLAAGLAKGVYGEFWGTALTARLPSAYTQEEGRLKRLATYQSLSMPGIEKMLGQLNMDLNLQRFHLPRYWEDIRYVYAPRDYSKHGKKLPYWWRHGEVKELKDLYEDAVFDGREDILADFEEDFKFFCDSMTTLSVDLFLRGGWRFYEYRKFLVWKTEADGRAVRRNGKLVVDVGATLKNVKGIGPYLTKVFIDDLFKKETDYFEGDTSQLYHDDVDFRNLAREAGLSEADLKKSDKQAIFKEFLYDKLIFQHLNKVHPTIFLMLERIRFMPKDEVNHQRGTILGRLIEYLKNIHPSEYYQESTLLTSDVLPMYLGALEMLENLEWKRHKTDWKQNRENGVYNPVNDPLDYEFNEDAIDRYKEQLKQFFDHNRRRIGTKANKIEYNDGLFREHLKGFYRAFRTAIDEPRWSRCNHTQGRRETLGQRHARFLRKGMAYVENAIAGNLFDFSEFYMHQAGSRLVERQFGEVGKHTMEMTPALQKIIFNGLPNLELMNFENIHQFEQAVGKHIGEDLVKIDAAVQMIDKNQALALDRDLITFLAQIIRDDRVYSVKVIGDLARTKYRMKYGKQASLLTDHFKHTIRDPRYSKTSDQIEAMVHTLWRLVHGPIDEDKIVGEEPIKIFGRTIPMSKKIKIFGKEYTIPILPGKPKKIEGSEPINLEGIIESLRVAPKYRLLETSPMLPVVFLLIILLLAKQAFDKLKKK